MKNLFSFLIAFSFVSLLSAQQSEKIEVPAGVVYNYCDSATYEKAKKLVTSELTGKPTYQLTEAILFIGPVLWKRFQDLKSLKKIEGGNVTLMVNADKIPAKMTQDKKDSEKVWDELRDEIKGKEFKLRKATVKELNYYWSVIAFDIDEPLIIVETKEHNYILNMSPKDMHLVWLDECPR